SVDGGPPGSAAGRANTAGPPKISALLTVPARRRPDSLEPHRTSSGRRWGYGHAIPPRTATTPYTANAPTSTATATPHHIRRSYRPRNSVQQAVDGALVIVDVRPEPGRHLVVAGGGPALTHPLAAAAHAVVRVVVRRRRVEDVLELRRRLAVAPQPQVRDAQRLADRRLVRLPPLRLLERYGRLGVVAVLHVRPALLIEVVHGLLLIHRLSQL